MDRALRGSLLHRHGKRLWPAHDSALEGPVTVAIRPENIALTRENGGDSSLHLRGTVIAVRPRPTHTEVELDAGERRGAAGRHQPGDRVLLRILPAAVKVFPRHDPGQ